jgi:hypothetical protein
MHPVRRSDLLVQKIDGEFVILDRTANKVHQLNAAASHIWDLCDGVHSVGEIAQVLAEEFDIGIDVAQRDVVKTVTEFFTLGLMATDRV